VARLLSGLGLVALAASLSVALPAAAADPQWTAAGTLPGEAPVFSVALDPGQVGTILAATLGAGLVRSDDGKTWRDIGAGVLPKRLWKVVLDPSRGPNGNAEIYVGSAGKGFFRSPDGGASWRGSTQGLSADGQNVRAVALGRGVIVIGTSDGVYRSIDDGATWKAAGLAGMDVSALAFAQYGTPTATPPTPAVLIAAIDGLKTPGSRVARSSDLGATWVPLKQGLPADLVAGAVAAGPVAPGGLRPLYIAGSGGVFKSDDVGDSWAQQAGLPQQGFGLVVPSPLDPNIVYAASDGGGASGQGASPGSILGGVWRSTDRGGSWTKLDGGLTQHAVTALAVSRSAPAALAALAYNPDGPIVQPYTLSDTQAQPGGTPEPGLCPEPQPCAPGDPAPLPAVAGSKVVAINPNACAAASPSPNPSARSTPGASPPPAASPSASPAAPLLPCPTAAPVGSGGGGDLPLPLVAAVIVVLAGLLVARIVLARR
jgi:hypothetical protein